MSPTTKSATFLAATALSLLLGGAASAADTTVQIPLPGLLDGRTVATLTGGVVVPWSLLSGVDGGGSGNGYMTTAASKSLGQNVKALPDDGKFPADANHPDVQLHYSNDAPASSFQTHPVHGAGTFMFDVPMATYSKLFLFATSSEGGSTLKVTLTYMDATTQVVNINLPDYFNGTAAPVFILYGDMAKWGHNNNIAEQNHHNLDGFEVDPMPSKMLTKVQVDKTANAYLVFWGATGIATSAVVIPDGGAGGGGGSGGSGGGTTGSDGGAGSGGAGGAGGAAGGGGTTGSAGTTGIAGTTGTAGAAGDTGTAGTTGTAGETGSAGVSGTAGASGVAGGTSGSTGTGGSSGPKAASSGGCGCQAGGGTPTSLAMTALVAMVLGFRRRRVGRP